jgi:hypothetical protein
MMKKLVATLMMTAIGVSTAHAAGSISMDARSDFEVNQYNDEAERGQSARDNHRFVLQTLRLDAKGNLSEQTLFRLRFKLNNGALGQQNRRDSINNAIDFAYVQQNFLENLSLQLGKFGTDIGGIEGMTASPDLYMRSFAYSGTSSLGGRTANPAGTNLVLLETDSFRYSTGAKLLWTMADQELDFMVTNQQSDATEGGAFVQNREGYGVVYKGSFFEKALLPVLSYHEDNVQTTPDVQAGPAVADKKFQYYGGGLKYDFAPIFLEADYLYNTYRDRSVVGEIDKTTTIVATLGTRWENFVARLKFEDSQAEIFTVAGVSGKNKINGYQLALEYLPANDKNFRYHVAYVQKDLKPDANAIAASVGTSTQSTQQVVAGVRIFADFLK